ncbi:hypothetical protein YC2023_072149 [Brassica napus]
MEPFPYSAFKVLIGIFATTTKICTDGRSARARALGFAATATPSYSSRPGSCPDSRHTQDVRGCPCVSVSTHKTSVAVHHTHRTSVGVRQQIQDVCGCPCVSVCVCLCPSAHTESLWLSISTHISTLVLGLSTLALPVDCLGDFTPRGLSVQYTQDVCGSPPAHTGRPWLSVSTHRMSVAVRVCPCVSVGTHKTSVAVHYTQDVRGCPCESVCVRLRLSAHTRRLWLSISTHISTLVLGLSTLTLPVDCSGDFGPRGLSVQYTQDFCGCPPAHTGRPWLSVSTHKTSVCVCVCPCVSISTHRTSVAVHQYTYQRIGPWTQHAGPPVDCLGDFSPGVLSVQYTQDVRGCPPAHTGRPWLSVAGRQHTQDVRGCPSAHTGCPGLSLCVRVCPSAQTGRPWLSIRTHISTLVLGLSTLALHVDCSGDFGPRGYLFMTHRTSVGFRQPTQDVCVCHSAHRTSVAVRVSLCVSVFVCQHTQDVCGLHTGLLWVSASTHRTSVVVRGCPSAHTRRPCVSVCVRVCPSALTGRPWLSISIHISALVLGLSTLALPVDCLCDFGPGGLSVQYTQDVRGCPPAHTGRPWLSVAGRQHTQDVRGCPSAHTGCPRLSLCVRVCPSAHTGRPWLSIRTHISTLVLGLSTLALHVDCSGDFGPRGYLFMTHRTSVGFRQPTQDVCVCHSAHRTSVAVRVSLCVSVFVCQHTQDVCGCPSVHISAHCTHRTSVGVRQHTQDVCGCPWLSVSTHKTSVCVCVCPCVSISTHRTSVAVHQWAICSVHTGCPWVSASTHRTSVAVCGWPSAHTGCPWLSVSTHRMSGAVPVCPCVSISTHRTSVAVHPYTYQHAGPWTQHAGPSRGLFGLFWPTWAIWSVHTGRPWVSVSTHRTSVCVRQHTQDICGCPCESVCVRLCPSAHTRRLWLSISTHISTLVLGLSTLTLPVDCSGDYGPRGPSVRYTHEVHGCPPAHTGRPWLSVCVRVSLSLSVSTHMTSVAVHQYTYKHVVHTGRPWVSASTQRTSVAVHGCPKLSVSTHRTSAAVRVCLWVSASTHRTTYRTPVAVHQYTYQHPGPWTQHAGPSHGLFGTHRTFVAVRVCPCVSIRTHKTSVAVHQYTYQHVGPWTQHADPSRGQFGTSVAVRVCPCVSVCVRQHTQDVCGWLSVQYTQDVRGCSPAHTGRLWLSVSTHRTSVAVCQHTHDVCGCPCVYVCVRQHTHDVCGCPPAHTRRLWLSVCVSMCVRLCPSVSVSTHMTSVAVHHTQWTSVGVRQHTQDVCGCLRLSVSTHKTSVAVRVCPCVSVSTHRTFVGVRQHTQDVRVCPSAHTGLPWLSVCVCVCPSTHMGCPWLSISTHISRLVLGLGTLALPVDCLGDFGPRGLSVQYTQDVRGCPPAHTGPLWQSVAVRQHTQDVCGCPCVSVCVRQHTQDVRDFGPRGLSFQYTQDVRGCPPAHAGRPWLSVAVRQHTEDVRDFGQCGLSVQCTQDVRGCPPAHTERPWLSVCVHVCLFVFVSTHKTSVAVHQYTYQHVVHTGRLWVSGSTHRTSVAVRQYTQDVCGYPCVYVCVRQHTHDVRGCPPAHTGHLWLSVCVHVCPSVSVSRYMTSVAVHQYTYQHVGPWTQHAGPSCGLFRTSGCPWLSEAVRQHTQDVCGCLCVSVGVRQHAQDVRGCPSAHTGCPCVSVCVRQHTHDVRALHTMSVGVRQHTQDVHGSLWLSVSTHRMFVCVRLCPFVPVSTHRTSVAVHQYTYQHVGPLTQHADHSRGLFGTSVSVRVCLSVSVSIHRTFVAVHQYTYRHIGPWTQHAGTWTQHAGPSRGLFG